MFEKTFTPQPIANLTDAIELQQMAAEFRQEIAHRQAFEAYCQWYDKTAQQHNDELAAMKHDIPILDWFLSFRR